MVSMQGGFGKEAAAERGSGIERKHCAPKFTLGSERKCELAIEL